MELRRILREASTCEYIRDTVDGARRILVRPASTRADRVLRQSEAEPQNVAHLEVGLNLRNGHVDDLLDLGEAHLLNLFEDLHYDDSHSLGTLEVIAYALTDSAVGHSLNTFQRLLSGRFNQVIILATDIVCGLLGVFVQLINFVVLHVYRDAANRVNNVRYGLEINNYVIADVHVHRLVQRLNRHLRSAIDARVSDFVVCRRVAELEVRIAEYRRQLDIVCLRVDGRDHDHVASGALDILHIAAVNAQQQNVNVSVDLRQRKIVILRSRLVHLIHEAVHVAVNASSHYQRRQQQHDKNQDENFLPSLHLLNSLLQALLFSIFPSTHFQIYPCLSSWPLLRPPPGSSCKIQ